MRCSRATASALYFLNIGPYRALSLMTQPVRPWSRMIWVHILHVTQHFPGSMAPVVIRS